MRSMAICLTLILTAGSMRADEPIPVIFDTDIGGDIDDTWALAYLLRSPELDLKLLVTDYGDTVYRAKVAARLLEIAGRGDVPIGIGSRQSEEGGPQQEWIGDYSLFRKRYHLPTTDDRCAVIYPRGCPIELTFDLSGGSYLPERRTSALVRRTRSKVRLGLESPYEQSSTGYSSDRRIHRRVRVGLVAGTGRVAERWRRDPSHLVGSMVTPSGAA